MIPFFLIRKGGMLEDYKNFLESQKVTSNLSVRNEFYQSTHLTMFSIGSRSLRNRLIGASSSGYDGQADQNSVRFGDSRAFPDNLGEENRHAEEAGPEAFSSGQEGDILASNPASNME